MIEDVIPLSYMSNGVSTDFTSARIAETRAGEMISW